MYSLLACQPAYQDGSVAFCYNGMCVCALLSGMQFSKVMSGQQIVNHWRMTEVFCANKWSLHLCTPSLLPGTPESPVAFLLRSICKVLGLFGLGYHQPPGAVPDYLATPSQAQSIHHDSCSGSGRWVPSRWFRPVHFEHHPPKHFEGEDPDCMAVAHAVCSSDSEPHCSR